jgi:hypothetical protein
MRLLTKGRALDHWRRITNGGLRLYASIAAMMLAKQEGRRRSRSAMGRTESNALKESENMKKKTKKPVAKVTVSAPVAVAAPAPTAPNKTATVLSMPRDIPAKEVVARCAKKGVEVTEQYVRVIWSNAKAKAAGGATPKKRGRPAKVAPVAAPEGIAPAAAPKKKGRPAKAKKAAPTKASNGAAHTNGASNGDSAFITMAIDMGLPKAEEILGRIRHTLVESACLELARRAQESLSVSGA